MQKNESQKICAFLHKNFLGAPRHPILLWNTLSISKKISRDFGVCPATQFIVRPATFSKTAKNLGKNRPKMASNIDFLRQNVVPYGCNIIFFSDKFYTPILTSRKRVTRLNTFRPPESSGLLGSGVWCTSKNRNFICIFLFAQMQYEIEGKKTLFLKSTTTKAPGS